MNINVNLKPPVPQPPQEVVSVNLTLTAREAYILRVLVGNSDPASMAVNNTYMTGVKFAEAQQFCEDACSLLDRGGIRPCPR